jgi:hypothetical protein
LKIRANGRISLAILRTGVAKMSTPTETEYRVEMSRNLHRRE